MFFCSFNPALKGDLESKKVLALDKKYPRYTPFYVFWRIRRIQQDTFGVLSICAEMLSAYFLNMFLKLSSYFETISCTAHNSESIIFSICA
jgi:hypothetical protein